MKKTLLTKVMLLLCALIAGSSSVWATEEEIFNVPCTSTPSGWTLTDGTTTNTIQQSDYWLLDPGGGDYVVTSSYDLSQYTTITITAQVATYGSGSNPSAKIEISYDGGSSFSESTTQGEPTSKTYVNLSYTLLSKSKNVVIKVSNSISSGRGLRFKNFVLTGVSSSPIASLSTTSLAFGRVKAGATKDLTFTVTPANLTSDLTIASTNDKYTVSPTSIAKATTTAQTITVTATPEAVGDDMTGEITISGGGLSANKSVTLSCIVRDPTANDGTAAKPYTVAEAIELIDEAGSEKSGIYVSGTISQIDEVSVSNKNATYWISDDGSTTNQLQAFRGKYLNNTDFTSENQISLYDHVVIVGDLTKYSSTYEFTTGNYIYSQTADTRIASDLAWSTNTVMIEKDAASYSLPSLTNSQGLPVTYTVSGTAGLASETGGVITVNTDIVGTATVTASFAGNSTYKPTSVSYTIKVFKVYTVSEVRAVATTETISDVYVEGYIIGYANSTYGFTTTTTSFQNSNWVIADSKTETDVANTTPVQIASANQTNYGLVNHPELLGAKVLIKGDITKYFNVSGIKNLDEITIESISVPIGTYKWGTFTCNQVLDFAGTDVTAYVVTGRAGTTLETTSVTTTAANTPLLVNAASAGNYDIPVAASGTDYSSSNLLKAGTGTAVSAEDGKTKYVLSVADDKAVFKKINATAATVAKGKAYLEFDGDVTAPFFNLFFEGETTGINAVQGSLFTVNGSQVYNLNGQRVANPKKGLYIVNGKKAIIK